MTVLVLCEGVQFRLVSLATSPYIVTRKYEGVIIVLFGAHAVAGQIANDGEALLQIFRDGPVFEVLQFAEIVNEWAIPANCRGFDGVRSACQPGGSVPVQFVCLPFPI